MLTKADIYLMTEALKEVFVTKDEFSQLSAKVDDILNILDRHIRDLKNINEEEIIARYRQERMEKWAERAGQKIDLKFEY